MSDRVYSNIEKENLSLQRQADSLNYQGRIHEPYNTVVHKGVGNNLFDSCEAQKRANTSRTLSSRRADTKIFTSQSSKEQNIDRRIDQVGEELLEGWGELLDANNWSKQQLEQDLTTSR